MSQQLKQLVASSAFLILYDNLEQWSLLYDVNYLHYWDLFWFQKNTCDENIEKGCDIIEMNAHLQSQLFKILTICASEGQLNTDNINERANGTI